MNSYQIYKEAIDKGIDFKIAEQMAVNSESIFNQIKDDFISSKFAYFVSALIFAAMTFLGAEVWNLSIKMERFDVTMQQIMQDIRDIKENKCK